MRVTNSESVFHRLRSERGVTGAIVTVMLTVFLGMTAFVIDLGDAWQSRRNLVTATDAAALAATQEYVLGGTGCNAVAAGFVANNFNGATMTDCTHTPRSGGTPGRVTVTADYEVTFNFARAIGINSKTVSSTTVVSYDRTSTVTGGLRPFGLCAGVLGSLTPTVVPGNGEIYRIYYGKDEHPTTCAGIPISGNWGILDFDGGSNPQTQINCWTEFGYSSPDECGDDEGAGVSIGDLIEGNPGAYSNALKDEMEFLLTVEYFTLPIFDTVSGPGGNAEFRIDNFAAVKLHGFKLTGPEKNRYLEIEFLDRVVSGTGGSDDTSYGAYVIAICAVDGTSVAGCD